MHASFSPSFHISWEWGGGGGGGGALMHVQMDAGMHMLNRSSRLLNVNCIQSDSWRLYKYHHQGRHQSGPHARQVHACALEYICIQAKLIWDCACGGCNPATTPPF